MKRLWTGAILCLLAVALVSLAFADEKTAPPEKKDVFSNLKFRNLGPAVGGGRVAAVAGIPGQSNVYYVGAAGGGVWKTVDGGFTWKAIFEKEPTASIGAIAVDPQNPNVVWVGTGESNPRNDMVTGKGVYMSTDAGATWKFMGLENVGQITNVIVDPHDSNKVFIGAMGRVWTTNPDRGVYRTSDGGKTWNRVLFVNDKTGVSDLIMDGNNPMVLFAGMWEFQRFPWYLDNGGTNSGIYRSVDGGTTWQRLSEGLPKGVVGRIGVAAAPSNPQHLYALIETKKGVLWESNDLGDHWRQVSESRDLAARGFYFSNLMVSPDSEEHIYFLSFNILESLDGGKTTRNLSRGVHPDNHSIWIDPSNPQRIIEGNDGGVYISQDAGKNWRYLDNLPIEQGYMVAADDEEPYLLCTGLQDNNAWCGPSSTGGRGQVTGAEWYTVAGGDGEYAVPAGHKSNWIYADSQNGSISRLDTKDNLSKFIRPYLHGAEDMATRDLKYRFNWTSPIAVDPSDPKTVYLGGNVLFKSSDGGNTWNPVSPDLTRNDKAKQAASGGPILLDLSGAETYDTILSMDLSPVDQNVVWVGTDDGVVQMTKDGGKTWNKVSDNIKGLPEWGRVQQIATSPFDANTAYVAFDFHETDINRPYVFKTHDGGKTWTSISAGLPEKDPARVVREDPNKKGFLVLGTDTGLFFSQNDGANWEPLKSNFPTVPIYDLKFRKSTHDLLVSTHGRGLFVLDNITPIEDFTPQVAAKDFHLFPMQQATKWKPARRGGGFEAASFTTPNAPAGVVIDYYLAKDVEMPNQNGGMNGEGMGGRGGMQAEAGGGGGMPSPFGPEVAMNASNRRTPVKFTVTDSNGQVVRVFYGPAKAGINRIVWDMTYDAPTRLAIVPEREGNEFRGFGGGPAVLPGQYKISVSIQNKDAGTEMADIRPDPRVPYNMEAARAQLKFALEGREMMSAMNQAMNRLEGLNQQIASMRRLLASGEEGGASMQNASYQPVLREAAQLERKVHQMQDSVYNMEGRNDTEARLHYLGKFYDRLQGATRSGGFGGGYNEPPTQMQLDELQEVRQELDKTLASYNNFIQTDVAAFNKVAAEKGAATLFAGNPIELKGSTSATGGQR